MNSRSASAALLSTLLAACGGGGTTVFVPPPPPPAPAPAPGTPAPNPQPSAPTQLCSTTGLAAAATRTNPVVCMLTSRGEMVFELFLADAPITVNNFLSHVSTNFYANTLIHRIESDFVFQGGGYTPGGIFKTAPFSPITLEDRTQWSNLRGSISMARTDAPNSATSQWFVNVTDNPGLDGTATKYGYAVFGYIISGLAVMDAIKVEPVFPGTSLPRTEVLVYWAQRVK